MPLAWRTPMDLNYLFLRQQMERAFAEAAASAAARDAHEEMARAYELAIERESGGRIVFSWQSAELRRQRRQ